MSIDIAVVDKGPQGVLQISVATSMLKIPKTLGSCFSAVTQYMESVGVGKAGAPFTQYLDLDWDSIQRDSLVALAWQLLTHKQKLRVGIPVSDKVQGDGEVVFAEIASGRFVKALHIGAYHKLGKTYKKVSDWALQNRVSLENNAFESYISDPGEVPTDKLETLVFVPISD